MFHSIELSHNEIHVCEVFIFHRSLNKNTDLHPMVHMRLGSNRNLQMYLLDRDYLLMITFFNIRLYIFGLPRSMA